MHNTMQQQHLISASETDAASRLIHLNMNILSSSGWQIVNGTSVGSNHFMHVLEMLIDNIQCNLEKEYYDSFSYTESQRRTLIAPLPFNGQKDTTDPLIFVYDKKAHSDTKITLIHYSPQGDYLQLTLRDARKPSGGDTFQYVLYSQLKDALYYDEQRELFGKGICFREEDGFYVPIKRNY